MECNYPRHIIRIQNAAFSGDKAVLSYPDGLELVSSKTLQVKITPKAGASAVNIKNIELEGCYEEPGKNKYLPLYFISK